MNRSEARQRVRELARKMVGKTIETVAQGKPNQIVAVSEQAVTVKAKKLRDVTWDIIDGVIDELYVRPSMTGQELRKARVLGGFRSAFIFPLLVAAGVAVAHREGRAVILTLAQ